MRSDMNSGTRRRRALSCTLTACAFVSLGLVGKANAQTCDVDFDDLPTIAALPNAVADTFLYFPPYYEQPCGQFLGRISEFIAEPCFWGHYHLGYDDPCVSTACGLQNGVFRDLECAGLGTGCEAVDPALQTRRLASMTGDHTLMLTLERADGLPNERVCYSPAGPDRGGCISVAGRPFVARSIDVLSFAPPPDAPGERAEVVTVYGLKITIRRTQVNLDPPIYAQVPWPTLVSAELTPGTWDLSSFGLVDRLLFDNYEGTLGCSAGSYSVDNIVVDFEPTVGESFLELQGWTDGQGNPIPEDSSNSTQGGSSLIVPNGGYNLLRSPVIDTADLQVLGDKLAMDVFVPSQQTNPYWVGDAQLFVSIPSAAIHNQPLGYQALTSLPRDEWSRIEFGVEETVLHTLRERHPDVQLDVAVNLNSNLAPTRLDFLRFGGNLEPTLRCGDGSVDPGEECDDGNLANGDGCSEICMSEGAGSICSESSAIDLGSVNTVSQVAADACLKVSDYPGSWATVVQLQSQDNADGYPLPFTWSNCVASGSGSFEGDWHQQALGSISTECPTLIHLQGTGSDSFSLSWWGNGG